MEKNAFCPHNEVVEAIYQQVLTAKASKNRAPTHRLVDEQSQMLLLLRSYWPSEYG